jgi:hypothetical protein
MKPPARSTAIVERFVGMHTFVVHASVAGEYLKNLPRHHEVHNALLLRCMSCVRSVALAMHRWLTERLCRVAQGAAAADAAPRME